MEIYRSTWCLNPSTDESRLKRAWRHDPSIQKPREVEETTDALTKLRRPWALGFLAMGSLRASLTVSARREQPVLV